MMRSHIDSQHVMRFIGVRKEHNGQRRCDERNRNAHEARNHVRRRHLMAIVAHTLAICGKNANLCVSTRPLWHNTRSSRLLGAQSTIITLHATRACRNLNFGV